MGSKGNMAWLCTLAAVMLGAGIATGCMTDLGPTEDEAATEELESGEATGEVTQGISGRHCVDQSTASVDYLGSDPPFLACVSPTWESQFSRNHPVNVHIDCGTYVIVKDLWSTQWVRMRADALRPC